MRNVRAIFVIALVTHPGAHTGSGEETGLRREANALNRLFGEGIGGALQKLVQRLFDGLRLMVRSPATALGVALLLAMLVSPLLLAQRRRQLQLLSEVTT